MEQQNVTGQARARRQRLLAAFAGLVPDMQRRAVELDRGGELPNRDLGILRDLGALAAPLPAALGGLGTEPRDRLDLFEALRLIGRGNLSVGRIFEGHVNALHLIVRYGTDAQARSAADDALAGHLFGLWVTDAHDAPLHLTEDGVLHGAKAPCSGAAHATRALLTARTPHGDTRMLVVALAAGERADLSAWDAHGMRATGSGRVTLNGLHVPTEALIGAPGDYLRQPDFSAGAWRTSAVTLGGLEALIAEARRHLVARGRQDDPHQRARIGKALIVQETARLWIQRAALLAEAQDGDAQDVVAYVNLARLAVETGCLEAIQIVQRALGLAAFRRGELVELLLRDLTLYLRQPAADEALTEAAGHFMQRDLPQAAAWT